VQLGAPRQGKRERCGRQRTKEMNRGAAKQGRKAAGMNLMSVGKKEYISIERRKCPLIFKD
jgi:hypothetical protein